MDKRSHKKLEIIEKSFNEMHLYGYNATGVKTIASTAKIAKGSLFNYFESKEDYGVQALTYYHNQLKEKSWDIFEDKSISARERIIGYFRNEIDLNYDDTTKISKGCFVGNIAQELAGVNEVFRCLTEKMINELILKIESCINETIKNEKYISDIESSKLSKFIVSSWYGSLLTAKVQNSKYPLEVFCQVIEEILDVKK